MLQDSIGAHWHVVVSHIELVLMVLKLASIQTHGSHVVLGNAHLVRFLPLGELLVHHVVLGEGGACEVRLVHLHLVRTWSHHVDQHG
jgi:hypothetical protein